MRVGVVGSGIAGLTAAWLFDRSGANVTVFEKHPRFGMDAQSVEFEIDGHNVRTDVPPRMFNDAQWPNISNLYREIGVDSEPVEPSKTFAQTNLSQSEDRRSIEVLLKLDASYQPKLSPGLLLKPATRQILGDIKRMLAAAPDDVEQPLDITFGEYLKNNQYSDAFIYQFLFPALSSTVCTCSYESLAAYPAELLLRAMLKLTQPEGLLRTSFGTRDVVQRLTDNLSDARLSTSVTKIARTQSSVEIETEARERLTFDHVIVATQANSARTMLDPTMQAEDDMLGYFRYEDVPVVVHTDDRLMPERRKDWSHFNLISSSDNRAAMCTIWMNRFCPEWNLDSPVFQTIMPLVEPRTDQVLCTVNMQRPVVNQESLRGLTLMADLHEDPNRRIWYCGSYASPGVPLLESGVVSSLKVAQKIGINVQSVCRAYMIEK